MNEHRIATENRCSENRHAIGEESKHYGTGTTTICRGNEGIAGIPCRFSLTGQDHGKRRSGRLAIRTRICGPAEERPARVGIGEQSGDEYTGNQRYPYPGILRWKCRMEGYSRQVVSAHFRRRRRSRRPNYNRRWSSYTTHARPSGSFLNHVVFSFAIEKRIG